MSEWGPWPLPGKPSWLAWEAPRLVDFLEAGGFAVDLKAGGDRQVMQLASEVGEFVGAYLRWTGQARRHGPLIEVEHELADVVVTAYLTAHILNIDLDFAAAEKLKIVYDHPPRET